MKVKALTKSKPQPTNEGCLGRIIFDVPVYRLDKEKYELQQEDFVKKEIFLGGPFAGELYRQDPKSKERMENHLRDTFGCWRFNEIVGFIRLYFLPGQIRGEYWRVVAKRITRTRRKVFEFCDWKVTHEEEIPAGTSSRGIFELILKYLRRAQQQHNLRRLHVDTSVIAYTGPHVDWNALLNLARRPMSPDLPDK